MRLKSKAKEPATHFREIIPEYNDDEIIDILRKRQYYQSEAVEVATDEALKRGIIHSEQDLFGEQFRTKPMKFGIFPTIEDERNRKKISSSIIRGFLITGILPVITGILGLINENFMEGGLLLLAGIIWLIFAALLLWKVTAYAVNMLLVLSTAAVVYMSYRLADANSYILMDAFIVVVMYLLLVYGLFFIRQLNRP